MEKRIHSFLPSIKDLYTINDMGEIFSDISGKMKTRNKGQTDYQIINFMTVDGKKKTYRVHRLVMMAFYPTKSMDLLEVNHIDGDKKNNSLQNLEWCSSSENQKHAFQLGLQKARKGSASNFAKLSKKDIERIFALREKGWLQKDIANKVGCTRSNISHILNNKTWQD